MSTVVLGVYDTAPGAHPLPRVRQCAIVEQAKKLGLPKPSFDTPDFMQATVEAVDYAKDGRRVVLIGDICDLHIPEQSQGDGIDEHEWREAWLDYLSTKSLVWAPLSPVTTSEPALSRKSVIRSFQRSCSVLSRVLARVRSKRSLSARTRYPGYSYGRPPYGYQIVDGKLAQHPERVPLVRRVIKLIRSGTPLVQVADVLREQCVEARADSSIRDEFWDAVKVRRLHGHLRLYCLGEYDTPGGGTAVVEGLAFLPAAWVDTPLTKRKRALVPSGDGDGTVDAHHPLPLE